MDLDISLSLEEKPAHPKLVKKLSVLIISFCILTPGFIIVDPATADSIDAYGTQWKEYRSENGITGFERNIPNSKYLETRAETTINAPIEVILEILQDTTSYPQWMYNCKEAIQLEQISEKFRVIYLVQSAPLGSPDRDVIITANSTADWDSGTYTISLQSSDTYRYPTKKTEHKRQRMTEFKGTWELRIVDRNRSKVIYTTFTDPGGFAPGFVVNSMIRKVSFLTLRGMIPMVSDTRYIKSSKRSDVKDLVESHWMSK